MTEDSNMKLIMQSFLQINDNIKEMKQDSKETKALIGRMKSEIKTDLLDDIVRLQKDIWTLKKEKLDSKDFAPFQSFFQKVNRLVRSILITAIIALVMYTR